MIANPPVLLVTIVLLVVANERKIPKVPYYGNESSVKSQKTLIFPPGLVTTTPSRCLSQLSGFCPLPEVFKVHQSMSFRRKLKPSITAGCKPRANYDFLQIH